MHQVMGVVEFWWLHHATGAEAQGSYGGSHGELAHHCLPLTCILPTSQTQLHSHRNTRLLAPFRGTNNRVFLRDCVVQIGP